MATVQTNLLTADEFWEWANRPENQHRRCELEYGEIVDVPPPGIEHVLTCGWIVHLLWSYVLQCGHGSVCSNGTGLIVTQGPDTVRGPGVILFGETLTREERARKYSDCLPALLVEVVSPSDKPSKINVRMEQYQNRGIPLVWLVDPELQIVTVYRPKMPHVTLDHEDELSGEYAPPGFSCPVAKLFDIPVQAS
jgi:Uma2 family endonuclease